MEFVTHTRNGVAIVEVVSDEVLIRTPQDGLDLLMSATYGGPACVVLRRAQLADAFFDLRTGLAGEVAQKAVNYGLRLAVTGAFDDVPSEAFQAFVREANRGRQLAFVPTLDAALERFGGP